MYLQNNKKLIILAHIIAFFSCKAQSIIKPIYLSGGCPPYSTDCYHKDIDNEFEKFVGEWKYTNGTTELVFKFKKELKYRVSDNHSYEDLLIGEYKYIENSVEKTNTLIDFSNTSISGYDHNISGGVLIHDLPKYCIDNSEKKEKKVELIITNPNNHLIQGRIVLRYINDNGLEKLEACIYDYTTLSDNEDDRILIPDGFYVFTKQ